MTQYPFRLVNVFAESALAGNALCVFEDARGLSGEAMQALARQFNLSETTFLLPSQSADARVRIFSPAAEFPFAGHPTLGSAAVVRELRSLGRELTLEMPAGIIPVQCGSDHYTLQAGAATTAAPAASRDELAQMLGLAPDAIAERPLLVSTGNEQLLVPLRSAEQVMRCQPDPALAARVANQQGLVKIYVWAGAQPGVVLSRFFFGEAGAALREDPGTGSACANLGAWMQAVGRPLPVRLTVHQGDHLHRACRLHLEVDSAGRIFVGGRVVEVGRGVIAL
jgi:trans-2,3-dihydro-3-hydroxyanthranilate isomerase